MPGGPQPYDNEAWGFPADFDLIARIEPLWRLRPSGPDQMLQLPAFLDLPALGQIRYGGGEKVAFSIQQALLLIGVPCRLGSRAGPVPTPIEAAASLHQGLTTAGADDSFDWPE